MNFLLTKSGRTTYEEKKSMLGMDRDVKVSAFYIQAQYEVLGPEEDMYDALFALSRRSVNP